jgi:tRNA-2-methylthio-N6-dimethylallyladenosine synthase
MNKTYYIITFGCQMNKNDSEHIAGMLEFNGYKPAACAEEANLVVLNTCAVRDKAERRVYGQLAKLNFVRKKKNLDMKLYLSGCMPAYNQEFLSKKFKYLDGFIDLAEAREYPAKRADSKQAWISIMYGCNNFCSYCIVPYTRGREISRSSTEIIEEIQGLDLTSYDDICLLGQNVNSYRADNLDFPGLIEKLFASIQNIPKLSFLTSHPKDMSDKLIDLIANNQKIDRELHFPLQAGNNRILQLMNRGYSYEKYVSLEKKIR